MTDNLLKEWQDRLGLQDWTIKLNDNVPADEMAEDSSGCVEWQESCKAALINILDPKDYGDRVVPFDYEKTLVHELLHLKLCLVSDKVGDLQERYMHQIIDDLARAFVDTKKIAMKERDFLREQVKRGAEITAKKVGKWKRSEIKSDEWVCSKCGGQAWMYDYKGVVKKSRYCPNCGAEMEICDDLSDFRPTREDVEKAFEIYKKDRFQKTCDNCKNAWVDCAPRDDRSCFSWEEKEVEQCQPKE